MRSILFALLFALLAVPAHAEFPRRGVAEVPNGIPEPFAGFWSAGFPQGEGVIVSEQIVSCEDPIRLSVGKGETLEYASPSGTTSIFELLEFEGRTTWLPANSPSSIAVWLSPESFYLYSVNEIGRADWDNPRLYQRCSG